MQSTQSYPIPRQRNLILAVLVVLTVACWAVLLWQQARLSGTQLTGTTMGASTPSGMGTSADMQQPAGLSLTMGMDGLLFMSMWVTMMVAMMFPTAAPMILTFTRVYEAKRQRGQSFVPTWVFVSAYMIIWAGFGLLGYAAALGLDALARQVPWLAENGTRIGAALLVLAGLYQLSPLKTVCLSKCRTPLAFVLNSWRDGYRGSFLMGLEHGLYCLGCCWLLFVILFPLGIMNVAAMALITLLIFAEKSLPWNPRITQISGLVLLGYGLLGIFFTGVLPSMVAMS